MLYYIDNRFFKTLLPYFSKDKKMTKAQEKNSKKISSGIPAEKKAFAFSNDMDESFFTYLADLKKLDVPSSLDKDELIWQIDKTMDSMREKIFYLAPAVENLIQILDDVSVNTKSKNDIFFASSLNNANLNTDGDFFKNWSSELRSLLHELEKNYSNHNSGELRALLIDKCSLIKVNYDYLEIFFNRITDYLTLWSEKDSIKIRNPQLLLKSYTAEQKKFLSEKMMLNENDMLVHLQSLFDTIQQLTELKHEVLRNHLRLVISVAQKFRNRGVSLNDIVQEGNLGLMRAIDKFDPHLGHKFSTYAVWWIKQNIIHSIAAQSRTIRIPSHMLTLINKINHAEQHLLQVLGREPESDEIAAVLELSTAKVNAVRCMARQAISLQTPIGNQNENFSLEDTLKDNSEGKDFTDFDKDVTYRMLYKLLKTLSPREQEIITLRFGLFGCKPTPFTELSERYGLTRERVRQLELKILNKLRAPEKLELLDYHSPNTKNRF